MKAKVILVSLFMLLMTSVTNAASLEKLWENSFTESYPITMDVNKSGYVAFINDRTITIMDQKGNIILKKANTSKDWLINLSIDCFSVQDGGDGFVSTAKIYDFKGNLLWKVKDVGVANFSPKGSFILFSDAVVETFKLYTKNGKLLKEVEKGALDVTFSKDEKLLSAVKVGIYELNGDQIKTLLEDEYSYDYARWDTSFVGKENKILIRETLNEENIIKLSDRNLNLLWSKNMTYPLGLGAVIDDLIVLENLQSMELYNVSGQMIKRIDLFKESMDKVIGGNTLLNTIVFTTNDDATNQKILNVIKTSGEIIFRRAYERESKFLYNDEGLLYITAKSGNSFKVECYRLK